MREHKYRVYNPVDNAMSPQAWTLTELMEAAIRIGKAFNEPNVWIEYTGLHDKNGVEIYEGDIVKEGKYGTVQVRWETLIESDEFGESNVGIGFNLAPNDGGPNNFEVIGNIYENPELLERGDAW